MNSHSEEVWLNTEIHHTFVIKLPFDRELRLTAVTKEEAEVITEALLRYYADFDRDADAS
jgi:hypothetical protein